MFNIHSRIFVVVSCEGFNCNIVVQTVKTTEVWIIFDELLSSLKTAYIHSIEYTDVACTFP